MKSFLIFLFSIPLITAAQKREQGYDFAWRETKDRPRMYAFIEKKNSLWHMKAYFVPENSMVQEGSFKDDSLKIKHGNFKDYYLNRNLKSTGVYVNDKPHGVWLRYHDDGTLQDSATYKNGIRVGIQLGWHKNGYLSDSIFFNADGSGTGFRWYDDGKPSQGGRYTTGNVKEGKWQWIQSNGKLRAIEVYKNGEVSSVQCFDENGNPATENCIEKDADFKGGVQAWIRYLQRNLDASAPVKNGAPIGLYTVAVQFIVETDGSLSNIKPATNFGFGMEAEAERILKKSPRWEPAIQYGRKVKAYRTQPITFVVTGG